MNSDWKKLLPGFAATMMGIGFSRFSFTPVSALMVEKHLLTSHDITIIAAFMTAAYAIGAFSAHTVAAKAGAVSVVRCCLIVVCIGLLTEGLFAAFLPVLAGRFIMSIAGAMLMVLGPGMILSSLPPEKRGFAAGFVFTGVGVGILISGSLVAAIASSPILLIAGALFSVALAVTAIGWQQWPQQQPAPTGKSGLIFSIGFFGLLIAYALDAIAFIPHTAYLSDFVASELGHGAKLGGAMWAIFGVGAIIGPAGAAWLRHKIGSQLSLELVFGVKAVFIAILGFSTNLSVVVISALVVGALVLGVVSLISVRTAEMVGPENITRAWGIMTGAFAIGQFAGATGMSAGYFALGNYQPLFTIAGAFEALGLIVLIVSIRFLSPPTKGISS